MEYFISWKGKFSLDLHLLISPVVISSALFSVLSYCIIFIFSYFLIQRSFSLHRAGTFNSSRRKKAYLVRESYILTILIVI
jgi:hypothetical protein